jgi:methionyl-tRNA synthetase
MTLFRCVRDLAIAIRCIVPDSADRLLDQLGGTSLARDYAALGNGEWFENLAKTGFRIEQPIGVFPRLEMPADEEAA